MDQKTRFLQIIKRILLPVELKSTISRAISTDSRPKWVKNTLTLQQEHSIMNSVQGEYTDPSFPAVNALDEVSIMVKFDYRLNFYRIEVFLNNDETLDAFLYWRIPEESSFRVNKFGTDRRWDLIAAKLDLLGDGLTYREIFRRISACADHNLHANDHLKFTLICDCPALEDVQFNDFCDSGKVMDIFFDDGLASKIRSIMDVEYIINSDIVARFAFG